MKKNNKTNIITRRDALKLGLAGAAGISVLDPIKLYAKPKPPVARAKSVIQIWMWGGPSHLDTFDPKPEAGKDYCGPLDKPIATNVDGVRICQLLPNLAKQADKYSIIRSMTHGVNSHETASYRVQTGHEPGRLVYPSVGAVVSLFKGYKQGYKGIVPPYIVMTKPQGRFSEAGFLGLAVFINYMHLPQSAPLVGGLVLTLMTLPTIIISTRASLKSVPPSIRDAALGVGASKMQSVFHHVLPLAAPGILTGTIIGLGELSSMICLSSLTSSALLTNDRAI